MGATITPSRKPRGPFSQILSPFAAFPIRLVGLGQSALCAMISNVSSDFDEIRGPRTSPCRLSLMSSTRTFPLIFVFIQHPISPRLPSSLKSYDVTRRRHKELREEKSWVSVPPK
jgi:hypothetical protein